MSMMNIMQTTGAKVKAWREKKGISQGHLAKLSGLHITTIGKIEVDMRPNPSINTLQKIADALGISLAKLLNPPPERR